MDRLEALAATGVQIRQKAPAWQMVDVHGRPRNSADFLGKVVVVNVFATWCIPCVWEIPHLVALQNKYWREGLVIIGIAIRQRASELLPFMRTNYVNFHVFPSIDSVLWDYGVLQTGALPSTVVINRSGVVHASWKYYHTKDFFENVITSVLAPPEIVYPQQPLPA